MTPVQWLTAQRLELAKQLLETTDLSIDLVAHRSVFAYRRSVARGGRYLIMEGPETFHRFVVIEFPTFHSTFFTTRLSMPAAFARPWRML